MSFLQACADNPHVTWRIENASTGREFASTVLPAFDRTSRNQGLLGRDCLPQGVALALAPCFAVHTWFMRFSLDLVFVARDGTVLKVRSHVAPWRVGACMGAFAVLELSAGGSDSTLPGHRLVASPVDGATLHDS